MRKEIPLAIIIGFSLGLVITFGVWQIKKLNQQTAPKTSQSYQESSTPPETSISPTPTQQTQQLIINSPEENAVVNTSEIEVSGKTLPLSTVVIIYEEGEKIIEADEEGNFSTEITLVGGTNEINISSYSQEGEEVSKDLTVIYSTAEI